MTVDQPRQHGCRSEIEHGRLARRGRANRLVGPDQLDLACFDQDSLALAVGARSNVENAAGLDQDDLERLVWPLCRRGSRQHPDREQESSDLLHGDPSTLSPETAFAASLPPLRRGVSPRSEASADQVAALRDTSTGAPPARTPAARPAKPRAPAGMQPSAAAN